MLLEVDELEELLTGLLEDTGLLEELEELLELLEDTGLGWAGTSLVGSVDWAEDRDILSDTAILDEDEETALEEDDTEDDEEAVLDDEVTEELLLDIVLEDILDEPPTFSSLLFEQPERTAAESASAINMEALDLLFICFHSFRYIFIRRQRITDINFFYARARPPLPNPRTQSCSVVKELQKRRIKTSCFFFAARL